MDLILFVQNSLVSQQEENLLLSLFFTIYILVQAQDFKADIGFLAE